MSINDEYINGDYTEKNPSFHVEDSPWKARQILEGLTRAKLSPTRIAEVGCGAGEILVQLSKELTEATFRGYELSPQGYEMCKERISDRISFTDESFFDEEETFDLALCIDVFEHIEDYFTFLRDLSKKANNFVFHIPLDMNVQMVARSKPILGVRKSVGHLHYYSKDTALACLKDCGLEVVEWFYTSNGVDRPKSPKAKALQIPRKLLFKVFPELTPRVLGGYSLLVVAKPSKAAERMG